MKQYETFHLIKGEDLNHHGTLFAARAAAWFVEAGFVAAGCVCGTTDGIVCRNLHQMSFQRPVKIGTILRFLARVVYTGKSSFMVAVTAVDTHTQVVPANNIPDGWEGLDAGPETQKAFAAAIEDAKTILWNGPAGVFEFDNFTAGSRAIAEAIAKATKNGAFSLIGGGDSVACINKFGMADQVSYISTGGGALLEAIEGKILPGVAAIKGE